MRLGNQMAMAICHSELLPTRAARERPSMVGSVAIWRVYWTLFGPYDLGRRGPRGTGPSRTINVLGCEWPVENGLDQIQVLDKNLAVSCGLAEEAESMIGPTDHTDDSTILRMWRNWQTRMIQVHVPEMAWRFKSSHPHQQNKVARALWPEPAVPITFRALATAFEGPQMNANL